MDYYPGKTNWKMETINNNLCYAPKMATNI